MSTTVAATAFPLFDWKQWDEAQLADVRCARRADAEDRAVAGTPLAEVRGRPGCVLEGGTIDAMGEQLVAGCDDDGDVLVICGTTLIVWAVTPEPVEVAGHYSIPHTAPGKFLVGGPSNAGGLFLNWVDRMLRGRAATARRPGRRSGPRPGLGAVPPRRARAVPGLDAARAARRPRPHARRGASVRRAAFEAAGFVTRRMIDASPVPAPPHRRDRRRHARRGVDPGAGRLHRACRSTCARFPKAARSVPRSWPGMAAGLETATNDAARWARTSHVVDPDPAWAAAVADRYARFCEVAG